MKDDISTGTTTQTSGKSNGKWQQSQQASGSSKSQENKQESKAGIEGIQDQVIDTAKQAYDTVVESASGVFSRVNLGSANTMMRQYPVQVAVGALAVGFLLGAAVCRRGE